ncbi:hypothetical protein CI109_102848 [Kwoniella shandongensis]|uniref:Uncharacterized protein n=1 Tax=Kwoniella shandongensis TaxID=1734106 RepID=A0AAJ8MWL7_9TREE
MTTSITDARYNVLHQTTSHTLSLSFDDPPETGWSGWGWGRGKGGVGNLLGTLGGGGGSGGEGWGRENGWDEWGLEEVVEREKRKEIPPGMAGAKRPPSPPSPALRPSHIPLPRSLHLRHLLERQQQASPPIPTDGFDAPVPNETYEEDQAGNNANGQDGQGGQGQVGQGTGGQGFGEQVGEEGDEGGN